MGKGNLISLDALLEACHLFSGVHWRAVAQLTSLIFCIVLRILIREQPMAHRIIKTFFSFYSCCKVTSVVSDSVGPHRRQSTRLPCPWDSPGKNTGVGCHFLLQCVKVKCESKSLSRVRPPATPWTAAFQAAPSMGFSRQEHWSGVPLPSPHSIHRQPFISHLSQTVLPNS